MGSEKVLLERRMKQSWRCCIVQNCYEGKEWATSNGRINMGVKCILNQVFTYAVLAIVSQKFLCEHWKEYLWKVLCMKGIKVPEFLHDILNIWYVHIHTFSQQNAQSAQTACVWLLLLNSFTILILLQGDTKMKLKYILPLLILVFL